MKEKTIDRIVFLYGIIFILASIWILLYSYENYLLFVVLWLLWFMALLSILWLLQGE